MKRSVSINNIKFSSDCDLSDWLALVDRSSQLPIFSWCSDQLEIVIQKSSSEEPLKSQVNALDLVFEDYLKVGSQILKAIHNNYKLLYKELEFDCFEELPAPSSIPESTEFFSPFLTLGGIYIFTDEKMGLSYYQLNFAFEFDPEHPLEIVLHGCRVISLGGDGCGVDLDLRRSEASYCLSEKVTQTLFD